MANYIRQIPLRTPNMGQYGHPIVRANPPVTFSGRTLDSHTQIEPPSQPVVTQNTPSVRRPYTGNFAVGDMFWGAIPTPLRTEGGENLMTVLRREAFTITLLFTSGELLNVDLDDLRAYHRLYHDAPLIREQTLDLADTTGDALTAAIEAHTATTNAAPTRRPYAGNFARGDMFWIAPRSGRIIFPQSKEAVIVLANDGRFLRLNHPAWESLSITIDELQQEAALYIDPPSEHDVHVEIPSAIQPAAVNHRAITLPQAPRSK